MSSKSRISLCGCVCAGDFWDRAVTCRERAEESC